MSSVYVARQPIFEVGRGLYGYELLYRRDISIDHADGDDTHMSADVSPTPCLVWGSETSQRAPRLRQLFARPVARPQLGAVRSGNCRHRVVGARRIQLRNARRMS
jgi:hypothetical protein